MKYVDFTEHYICDGDDFSIPKLKQVVESFSTQGWEFVTIVPKSHNTQSQMSDGRGTSMTIQQQEVNLYAVFGRRELADVLYNEKV